MEGGVIGGVLDPSGRARVQDQDVRAVLPGPGARALGKDAMRSCRRWPHGGFYLVGRELDIYLAPVGGRWVCIRLHRGSSDHSQLATGLN